MAATHAVSDYMQEIPLQKLSYAPGQHALDGSRGGGGECFCPGATMTNVNLQASQAKELLFSFSRYGR